jgi:hypothetical protein
MKRLLLVFMLAFISNSYSQIADLKGCWKSVNGNDTIVLNNLSFQLNPKSLTLLPMVVAFISASSRSNS